MTIQIEDLRTLKTQRATFMCILCQMRESSALRYIRKYDNEMHCKKHELTFKRMDDNDIAIVKFNEKKIMTLTMSMIARFSSLNMIGKCRMFFPPMSMNFKSTDNLENK